MGTLCFPAELERVISEMSRMLKGGGPTLWAKFANCERDIKSLGAREIRPYLLISSWPIVRSSRGFKLSRK